MGNTIRDVTDIAQTAEEAVGSRFALVGAIVARAHQLSQGHPPAIVGLDAVAMEKPAMVALREIAAGAVEVQQSAAKRGKVQHLERDEQRDAA